MGRELKRVPFGLENNISLKKHNFTKLKREVDKLQWTKVQGANSDDRLFCVANLSPETTLELFPHLPAYKHHEYNAYLKLFERDASKALVYNVYVTSVGGWNRLTFILYDPELLRMTKTREEQERRIVSLSEFSSKGEPPYIDVRPRPHWLFMLRLAWRWCKLIDFGESFANYHKRIKQSYRLWL